MPHTPGPWTVAYYLEPNEGLYSFVAGPNNECVVDPIDGDGEAFMRIDNNDARLIAQAPAMYELLKEVEWQGTLNGQLAHGACPFCNGWSVHYEFCRLAAILKAIEEA